MNIYHRLLNILAEQLQPEYWTIPELVHYIDLAQRQFYKDSGLYRKIKGLVPSFNQNEPAAQLPVTITTILDKGLYQVPEDSIEIKKVWWRGKLLDKANYSFINSRFAGNSHFSNIRGMGSHYDFPLKHTCGEPSNWVYDNGIRIVPSGFDDINFWFVTITDYDMNLDENEELTVNEDLNDYLQETIIKTTRGEITSDTHLYIQNSRYINTIGGVKYYDEGQWSRLRYNKDYFISSKDGFNVVFFSEEVIHKIGCKYENWNVLPNLLFINPSRNATLEYIPLPTLKWDLNTINIKGVEIETPEIHHEAIACYAAFLALSKEGKKTQDIEKAQIYLSRFTAYISDVNKQTKGSVNVDRRSVLPFRL